MIQNFDQMDSYAIKIDISIKPEHIGGRVVPK